MRQKVLSLGLTLVVLAGLLVGCATSTPAANAKPIKIGVFVPMTGPNAGYAQRLQNGVNLALSEVKNTIAGRPVVVDVLDEGGSDPAFFMANLKKMVEQDKVDIIVGPFNTAMSLAGAAYIATAQIIDIPMQPTAGDPATLAKTFGGWTIVPQGEGYQLTYPFGQWAATQGYKKITVVGSDFAPGRRFMQGFMDGFTAGGGTITNQQWLPYSGTPDMAPTIAALGTADAVVDFLIPVDMFRFVQQYNQLGYFSKMPVLNVRSNSYGEPDLPLGIGDSVSKVTFESQYEVGLDNAANKKFLSGYQTKYGTPAGNFEELAYVAASVAVAGLQATKGDTTPATLQKAIVNLKIQLPGGSQSFTPTGFGVLDDYVAQPKLVNGQWKMNIVATFPATRAKGQ